MRLTIVKALKSYLKGHIDKHIANVNLMYYNRNVIVGHHHRFDMSITTQLDGSLLGGWANGCLADLSLLPDGLYSSFDSTQRGLTVIHTKSNNFFSVEQHLFVPNKQKGYEQTEMHIGNDPVMLSAVDVVSKLMIQNKISLKARANSIPNAVAVANIITEKMLVGSTKIEKINLDTVAEAGIGDMTSTIEIIIVKNQ